MARNGIHSGGRTKAEYYKVWDKETGIYKGVWRIGVRQRKMPSLFRYERVDIVKDMVSKKYNFTTKDKNYIEGKPITFGGRNKTFDNYNDGIILAHKSFKRLKLSDNQARKEHLKYMKELTKNMTVKHFDEWFVENKGASDWFKNEYLKGQLFDELTDKDVDTLMNYFNSLSGMKKELVIKQALNKIKEKYENSDNPADYKFKAYNSVMQNLINYGKNEEVS